MRPISECDESPVTRVCDWCQEMRCTELEDAFEDRLTGNFWCCDECRSEGERYDEELDREMRETEASLMPGRI